VILLYETLLEKRPMVIAALQRRIPKEVRAYSRVSRVELRESIERHYDAFLDFLITGNDEKLKRLFGYVARVRDAQGFSMAVVLKALLCIMPVLRDILLQDKKTEAISQLDQRLIVAAGLFVDAYTAHLQSKVDQYNAYLNEQEQNLGVDLSKLILFRG
jgi:hypothetical protein